MKSSPATSLAPEIVERAYDVGIELHAVGEDFADVDAEIERAVRQAAKVERAARLDAGDAEKRAVRIEGLDLRT